MQITHIGHDMTTDTYTVALNEGAIIKIAYNSPDEVDVNFHAVPGMLDHSSYLNTTCLIADVFRAIVNAQECDGAELPSDCQMPIDVPNTFECPALP